jgi:hypothetical protein
MCAMARVVDSVPRPAATDVPTDVRLAAVFSGDCGGPSTVTLTLSRADDGSVLSTEETAWEGDVFQIFELYPPSELDPDTGYVLTVTPDDGSGEVTEIGFTTGSARAAELDGLPSFTIADATSERGSGIVVTESTLTAASDPDRLSLLVLTASGAASGEVVVGLDGVGDRLDSWSGGEGEVCLQVTQLDATGAAVDGEPACAEVQLSGELPWSCNSAGGGMSALGVLLAFGLGRRR